MAYRESNGYVTFGHVTDDVTWPCKVKLPTPNTLSVLH